METTQPIELAKLFFSANWNNKLDNKAFTTFRLTSRYRVGQKLAIELKAGKNDPPIELGTATVVAIKRLYMQTIDDHGAYLDTGYSANECRNIIKNMYPKVTDWDFQPIYSYLLVYDHKVKINTRK